MESEKTSETLMQEAQQKGLDEEAEAEQSEKSVIVGRVWVNGNVISGYVVVAPGVTIKFGGDLKYNPAFLFLTKKK